MGFATIATFIGLEIASGFLKEHGKEIYHKAKSLLTPDELITLNLLEKYPQSKELQSEVTSALQAHLEANPDIAQELEVMLNKLPAFEAKQNAITQTGDGNIAVQDIHGSKIDINK